MQQSAKHHQPWTITVQAKTKILHFKFNASRYIPSLNSVQTRFGLILKTRLFKLSIDSNNGVTVQRQKSTLKSKLLQIREKLHIRRNKTADTRKKSKKMGDKGQVGFLLPRRSAIDGLRLSMPNLVFNKFNVLVIFVASVACFTGLPLSDLRNVDFNRIQIFKEAMYQLGF